MLEEVPVAERAPILKAYLKWSLGARAIIEVSHKAPVEEFDRQFQTNVRGPYSLTQALLPMLKSRHGQIVFLNSSAGIAGRAGAGQYAATKHALRAVADSLREEVNQDGVRVLTVFLGRTATPMQAAIHQAEGKAYHPERLIRPEDGKHQIGLSSRS